MKYYKNEKYFIFWVIMKAENKYVNKAIIKILLRNVHFMYFFLIHRKFLLVKQDP